MGSMGWDGYTHRIWHNDGDADKATCQPPGFVLATCRGVFFRFSEGHNCLTDVSVSSSVMHWI